MATILHLPTAATPIERILSGFKREQVASFIEVAIGLLDALDGDPDVEPNGDEADIAVPAVQNWERFAAAGTEDDEQDDPPEDDDSDRCLAGDDGVFSGAIMRTPYSARWEAQRARTEIGDADDAEGDRIILGGGTVPAERVVRPDIHTR